MSKKLLMNNYAENGLMPVTDGLICWLDARDVENGNAVWVDRSGNGNDGLLRGFTFDEKTNGRIGNSLIFDGQECNVLIEIKRLPLFEGNNFSIQANAKIPPYSYAQRLFQRRDTSKTYRYYIMYLGSGSSSHPDVNNGAGNKIQFATTDYGLYNYGVITKQEVINNTRKDVSLTIDGVNTKLYIDGDVNSTRELGITRFDDYNPFIVIGSGSDRDKATTDIGKRSKFNYNSLKIYNRALTDEEIQQNYEYEQSIERGE